MKKEIKKGRMHPIVSALEEAFIAVQNPKSAARQSAYLKNLFPFLGLHTPLRKDIQEEIFAHHKIGTEEELVQVIEDFWMKEAREFQLSGCDIANLYKDSSSQKMITTYEAMIRNKSWWDTVDDVAADLVGPLVLRYPKLLPEMDQWITDDNLWIRRSAILCQLRWKDKTDERRLFDYCERTMHEKEFFIRKAIGWVLRQYSKTNPAAVKDFVKKHRANLSGISLKEATKYI